MLTHTSPSAHVTASNARFLVNFKVTQIQPAQPAQLEFEIELAAPSVHLTHKHGLAYPNNKTNSNSNTLQHMQHLANTNAPCAAQARTLLSNAAHTLKQAGSQQA
jgi:hypothetical protein